MNRAYSLLEVRTDEEQRIIRGLATSPAPDRLGDVVEPLGLTWRGSSVPLLWQHAHDQPLAQARLEKPTPKGVAFEARLPKVAEPSPFRDRVEDAWQSVKHGAVKGVSIGFRPLETAPLPNGGLHFKRAEILEISLVSIPANAACTVTSIKAFDRAAMSRSGSGRVVYLNDARGGVHSGDTGRPGPVADSIADAIEKAAKDEAARRKLGPVGTLTAAALAASATATDEALAELCERLARLERERR